MKQKILYLAMFAFIFVPALAQPQSGANKIDSLGRKQGYWKKFSNDTLKYEGTFKDNVPLGEFKYYYPGQKIKSVVMYSDNGLKAATVNYHENGKKMAEGDYWDKKKNGTWKYYNEDEILKAIENYSKGTPEGEWITYYENVKPYEIQHYKNGLKNGEWIRYYPDSVLCFKGTMVNDKRNGTYYFYNLDKKLELTANYQDDIENGLWFYFDQGGLPDKRITYSHGRVIKEEITVREDFKTITYVDISQIAYIFYNNGKVTVRLHDGTDRVSIRKIDEFEKFLNIDFFYRVNSNYIVTRKAIQNLKSYSQTERLLKLKPQPPESVYVSERLAGGFLGWAGLLKSDTEIKNQTNEY